jgi:hypothetical protein
VESKTEVCQSPLKGREAGSGVRFVFEADNEVVRVADDHALARRETLAPVGVGERPPEPPHLGAVWHAAGMPLGVPGLLAIGLVASLFDAVLADGLRVLETPDVGAQLFVVCLAGEQPF